MIDSLILKSVLGKTATERERERNRQIIDTY